MARTIRTSRKTKPRHERQMPTRPPVNIAMSHEAFTRITQPQVEAS